MHPAESKNVSQHSSPVPILTVHKARNEAEMDRSDPCQGDEASLAMFVTSIGCETKYIAVARQVVLKAMCETPVLVSIQATALVYVRPIKTCPKKYACMTAKGIVNAYTSGLF